MFLLKKYFLLFSACVFVSELLAESSNSSPYTITASLAAFIPGINSSSYGGYPVKLTIENTSQTKRTFLMMTCSWQDEWKVDNKNFYLKPSECQSNFEAPITLAPGQKKVFYGQVLRKTSSEKNEISEVRFGFIEFTDSLFIRNMGALIKGDNKSKLHKNLDKYEGASTYWSNKVSL